MSSSLVPLAIFLLNETTKDIYVLPPEAAVQIEGARPCAPIKTNITAATFFSSTLDQMCTSVAQSLLPRVNSMFKISLSTDHATAVGAAIRALQTVPGLRNEAPVWPPEIPFTLSGLTSSSGMNILIGVRTADKQAAILERIDVWSSLNDRLTRTYWSRSLNDPTYSSVPSRILTRVSTSIQRAWKKQSSIAENQEALRIIIDKKVSERELTVIENILKAHGKRSEEIVFFPTEVRPEGIVYQTSVKKSKLFAVVGQLARELPTFRSQSLDKNPVNISVMSASSQ